MGGQPTADYAIVGGGIVGLAVARQILIARPTARVTVFEKEPSVAAHASGRNSGVLHAGFYYSPDSLKAHLTRRGNSLLSAFCDDAGIPVRRCGKVVVTRSTAELPRLDELAARGAANGVVLESVDEEGLRELEPLARTVGRALYSPTTAVADPVQVVSALARDVEARGGLVRLGAMVHGARPRVLEVGGEVWSIGHLVNCAGLYADRLAESFGFCDDYVVVPFKGVYRYGNWEPGHLRRHVYPVPDPRNPFLGVHVTVTPTGGVKIGPTAIPVLWRENYRRLQGFKMWEFMSASRGLARFLGSDAHASASLVRTELVKYSYRMLAKEAAELVPTIHPADFKTRGRPGIRAQLANRSTGDLEMDFVVRGDASSTHILNAVSPAWTGALAFAEYVTDFMAGSGAI